MALSSKTVNIQLYDSYTVGNDTVCKCIKPIEYNVVTLSQIW